MYIIEYTFRKHHSKTEPLFCDYESCDHYILGYFETFDNGRDFMRVYHESTYDDMEHKDYKEEMFNCTEFSHDRERNEIKAWKKWECKENEETTHFYYEELRLHYIHNLVRKDPFVAICELIC